MAAADAEAAGVPVLSPPALPERFGVTLLYEVLEMAARFGQRPDQFVSWIEREPGWLLQLLEFHRTSRQIESGEEGAVEALRAAAAKPRGA